jgi:hypothetical protein
VASTNEEHIARPEFNLRAAIHHDLRAPRNDQTDVFDFTAGRPSDRPYVLGPLPARLVAGPTHGHAPNFHQLEFALLKDSRRVRSLESFDDHVASDSSDLFRVAPS